MSEFSEQKLNNLLELIDFKAYTLHTITDARLFREQLKKIREQNFATDEEEYCLGLTCIACPIRDSDGNIAAALSISGPTVRMSFNKIISIKEDMLRLSEQLSAQLGLPDTQTDI